MAEQPGTQPAHQQPANNQGAGNNEPRARLGTAEQIRQVAALIDGDGPEPDDDDAQEQDGHADGGEDGGAGNRHGAGDEGDGEEGDQADDDKGEPAGQLGKPESLDAAAKALGLTRSEFNALPVQVGPHTLTLGELKAKLPDLVKLDQSRAEVDDARGEVELRRVDTERRSRAMLDAVPPGALPLLEERVTLQHREQLRRESELLMSARPKWADQAYCSAERDKMAGVASRYGFSKAEIGAMIDHRAVLLLQDYAALLDKVQSGKDAARKTQQGGDPLTARQVRTASQNGQRAAGRQATQDEMAAKVGRILSR
jgi:hypothetical protein